MKKLSICILGLVAFSAPNITRAADMNRPMIVESAGENYFAARIGLAFSEDTSFDLNSAAAVPTAIDNSYEDHSLIGKFALGKELKGGLRGEIELGFGRTDIESHTIVALPATLSGGSAFGTVSTTVALLNGYYDLEVGNGASVYVGGGLGWGWADFENHGVVIPAGGAAGLPAGPITAMSDNGDGFAWQIGAGMSVPLDQNTKFEVGYRYEQISDVELTAVDGTESNVDVPNHAVTMGFRFNFN